MNEQRGNPTVTIYITSYNYGKYIEKAIKSVIAQTFTGYELIIIDDGSSDDSREIINRYASDDRSYTIFQENKGLNASNNVALKIARGKYIIRLDADDYFAPQAIEVMVSELERNPDCALVFPDYYHITENGEIIEEIKRHKFPDNVSLLDQPAHGACTMIRTNILKSIGGYDEEFNRQDGYDIWLRLSKLYPVRNVALPLFFYRQHAMSITKNEEALFHTRTQIIEKNFTDPNHNLLKTLAIIPVRGSEIDPNSDPLRMVGGKRLIDWTIDSALESDLLQDVIVTSNDEILHEYISDKYEDSIIWIERSKDLTKINTKIEDTAIFTINAYEEKYEPVELVMMLYSDFPFRSSMYIKQAIHLFHIHDLDSVTTVRKDDDMFYVHSGHGLIPWHRSKKLRLERDELYRRAGGLHLIKKDILLKEENMLYGKMGHVAIDSKAAFRVNTSFNYEIANMIAIGKTND